jgi:hypothetical protein
MKKWSSVFFDYQDSNGVFYLKSDSHALEVKKGQTLGLVGGAVKVDGKVDLQPNNEHLHLEVYLVTKVKVGDREVKRYTLIDPYGAWTESGKEVYGMWWLPGTTEKSDQVDSPTFLP